MAQVYFYRYYDYCLSTLLTVYIPALPFGTAEEAGTNTRT